MFRLAWRCLLGGLMVFAVCSSIAAQDTTAQAGGKEARPAKKPSLAVKASQIMGFTPAKIRFVGEVKGGPDDYEDLYCPSIEWDWGDDTTSESSVDCEPYQAGKSQITRRFTIEHVFDSPGQFRVRLRLKKKTRVILSADVVVSISPGIIRDPRPTSRPVD